MLSRIQNSDCRRIRQQPLLGGRVFAVGFDVHAEVFVMFGISEAVMFFSPSILDSQIAGI
jgi:hypothetical protein